MKTIFLFLSLIFFYNANTVAQLNGAELIQKSIALHDPDSSWNKLYTDIDIVIAVNKNNTLDTTERKLMLDLEQGVFEMRYVKDEKDALLHMSLDTCYGTLENESEIDPIFMDYHKITCARAKMFDSYYRYLIGLPMKLADKGVIINPHVTEVTFKEKNYNVVKVTYEPTVGSDTWKFYLNPETHQLEIAEFSKNGLFDKGEKIVMSMHQKVQNVLLPGRMEWYALPYHVFLADEKLIYRAKKRKSATGAN
jgi:hypothetical protein